MPSPKSPAARLRGRTRPRLAGPYWDHFIRFGCSRMASNALEVAFFRVRCMERKPLKTKGNTARPTSYGMEARVGIEPTNKGFDLYLSSWLPLRRPPGRRASKHSGRIPCCGRFTPPRLLEDLGANGLSREPAVSDPAVRAAQACRIESVAPLSGWGRSEAAARRTYQGSSRQCRATA